MKWRVFSNPLVSHRVSLLWILILLAGGQASAQTLYFPSENSDWETVTPETVGWDAAGLSAALDVAGARSSSGMVILHNGRILAERYWNNPSEISAYRNYLQGQDDAGRAIEDVASAQKSIVAVLTGMAQERGFLQIEQPVSSYLGTGWSQAAPQQESRITVRHLLAMTSGLNTDLTFAAEAGEVWLYNTPAYHFVMRIIESVTGKDRNTLTSEWIKEPLGMHHSSWTSRPWADAAIGSGFSTTARDLAKFGLMIQAGGHWGDREILGDTEYLHAMLSPSQALNPAYGYLWWINGQDFNLSAGPRAERENGSMIASAPDDLVAMQGAFDRKLYLVPSLGLVISRLGAAGGADGTRFNDAFWSALMRAKKE